MKYRRRSNVNKKSYVDPQTGLRIFRGLDRRLMNLMVKGQDSKKFGELGEEFIASLHPHWRRPAIPQEGFDFIGLPRRKDDRPPKIEVKTIGSEFLGSGKIFLRIKDGHWHNQVCDEVLFVSTSGIWKADAGRLRVWMKNHVSHHPRERELSFRSGKLEVEIDFKRLIDSKIVVPMNIHPEAFYSFLLSSKRAK